MKLHEASAVFLIIGSVLLGPIEGIATTDEKAVETCVKSITAGGFNRAVHCREVTPLIPETTAETCDRAMREIGATESTTLGRNSSGERVRVPSGYWYGGSKYPGAMAEFGGQRVLCIPAPTGLKQ